MENERTEIVFLVDRSGSMSGLESDTIGGFNSFMESQCRLGGEIIVTTVLFDNKYEVLWDGISGNHARLTTKEYYVRGMTALLDAIGKAILDVNNRYAAVKNVNRADKLLFVITTDGLENSSEEFTYEKVRNLIQHQKEHYNWEFIFLGANIDVSQEAGKMGIDIDESFDFEASSTGVEKMYERLNEVVYNKRTRS